MAVHGKRTVCQSRGASFVACLLMHDSKQVNLSLRYSWGFPVFSLAAWKQHVPNDRRQIMKCQLQPAAARAGEKKTTQLSWLGKPTYQACYHT